MLSINIDVCYDEDWVWPNIKWGIGLVVGISDLDFNFKILC